METKDLVLAYRQKTGCKQYHFDTYNEMRKYFDKKCYKGETIYYIEFDDSLHIDHALRGTFIS